MTATEKVPSRPQVPNGVWFRPPWSSYRAKVIVGTGGEPRLGISGAEAAEILGIHELSVSRLVRRGILHKSAPPPRIGSDPVHVERLALERYACKTIRTGPPRPVRPRSWA